MNHFCLVLLLLGPALVAASQSPLDQQQRGAGRRVLAVRDGRSGSAAADSLLRADLSLQEVADARLCAMQCLQHACVGWSKVYMGLDSAPVQPGAVPAAAAECLALCGMPVLEGSCLAQTFTRLLNTSPLQFSCETPCIAGLLHSSCNQCSGASGASGCHALHLGATAAAPECLVDAAL